MAIGSICAWALLALFSPERVAGIKTDGPPIAAGGTVPVKQTGSGVPKPAADSSRPRTAVEPTGGDEIVEVGKSYRFVLANAATRDVRGKVVGTVGGNWVKVEVRSGDSTVTARVNLAAVAVVVPERDE